MLGARMDRFETMRAIVRTAEGVELRQRPRPSLRDGDVLVRVMRAGVCRTDVHVARGRIACVPPRILGHEGAGVVADVGRAVTRLERGAHVAIRPSIECGRCEGCDRERCVAPLRIGIDRDGVFAELVAVPASAIVPVPAELSFERAAFIEPIAAALAVFRAPIDAREPGRVIGGGRIAELTRRVLEARGFRCSTHGLAGWAIETSGTEEGLSEAIEALVRGGTLVVKSRPPGRVPVDLAAVVERELALHAVRHGSFQDAIEIAGSSLVEDLLGNVHPLDEFASVLEDREDKKTFFAPNGLA
jgi:threonine dehydrogenase-like Zn-dependent dehydrogenase